MLPREINEATTTMLLIFNNDDSKKIKKSRLFKPQHAVGHKCADSNQTKNQICNVDNQDLSVRSTQDITFYLSNIYCKSKNRNYRKKL